MKSFRKKDSLIEKRGASLKKNLKKRKKQKLLPKEKNVSTFRQMD